ncbi:MAG TPA: L,D-transpeptidase family protein [Sphingomicrobium sp.]|jgi:lipoprotein-anchoring transpeptidase ErfK/SrfK|nr:L,D-transpeptidase family protein [Sphingomicrobium sp.]
MKQLAIALAMTGACVLATSVATPASALETYEAKAEAADAAIQAHSDMLDVFGPKVLKPGQYLWRDVPQSAGPERVVIGLSDQLAYLYRGNALVAVAAISTGRDSKPTPTGIFSVLDKQRMHRSRKYDNAPMPWMQRIDQYGIAMHGGHNPGYPASHGCIRLPSAFAKKLYSVTGLGTPVIIGL